ncbi:MAG: iron ABC transporter permease [Acidimicrobiia bacterium]
MAVPAVVIVSVSVGAVPVPMSDSLRVLVDHLTPFRLDPPSQTNAIVWNIRLPRTVVAMLVGMILGIAGTVLQGSLRNPIADAQLIGLSSAGAVGGLTGFWLGYASGGPTVAIAAGAVAGVCGALCVLWLSSRVSGEPTRFILVGVGAGLALGALVAAASIAIHDPRIPDVAFWFFGGLGASTWEVAGALALAGAIVAIGVMPYARRLDILSLGHDAARHVGVNVGTTLIIVLGLIGLGVGASVGAAGSIGFVGLVAGRTAVAAVGPHHHLAIPASALAGGLMVALADVVGRIIGHGFEVPVGLVTAIIGGLYLVGLITRNRVPI